MADERQDERETIFKFIEEVHNCTAVWDVSSAAYKDTKNKQIESEELAFYFSCAFCFFSGAD